MGSQACYAGQSGRQTQWCLSYPNVFGTKMLRLLHVLSVTSLFSSCFLGSLFFPNRAVNRQDRAASDRDVEESTATLKNECCQSNNCAIVQIRLCVTSSTYSVSEILRRGAQTSFTGKGTTMKTNLVMGQDVNLFQFKCVNQITVSTDSQGRVHHHVRYFVMLSYPYDSVNGSHVKNRKC